MAREGLHKIHKKVIFGVVGSPKGYVVLRSLCKTADLTCKVYSECICYCYSTYSLSTYRIFKI